MKIPTFEALGLSLALTAGCASNIGSIKAANNEPPCPQGTHLLRADQQTACARDLDVCLEVPEIEYIRKRCAGLGKKATVVQENDVPMWRCEK